jgi:hypothetical protein
MGSFKKLMSVLADEAADDYPRIPSVTEASSRFAMGKA